MAGHAVLRQELLRRQNRQEQTGFRSALYFVPQAEIAIWVRLYSDPDSDYSSDLHSRGEDTAICANETYDFYGTLYNTPDNRWTPGQTYPLEIHDESVHGCDSMVLHRVTVYPVFLDQWEAPDTVCQVLSSTPVYYEWEGAAHTGWNSRHPQKLNNAGTFELEDRLTTIHGCDSIIHRTLVVMPTYDIHVPHTMSSEDTVHWERRIYAGLTAVFDNPGGL